MLLLDSGKFQQFEKNVNIYMLDTAWKTEVLSTIFFLKIQIRFWHQTYVDGRGLDENKDGF